MSQQNKYEQIAIQPSSGSDYHFFTTLTKYKPLCYAGNGVPAFLYSQESSNSLYVLLFLNVLLLLIVGVVVWNLLQSEHPSEYTFLILLGDVLIIITMNISYLLTIFLNPGIRNLSTITDEEYWVDGKVFCSNCRGYRTGRMKHCKWCEVCVQDFDHHCGYFGKCIAGYQRFVFYICLCSVIGGFIAMLLALSSVVDG